MSRRALVARSMLAPATLLVLVACSSGNGEPGDGAVGRATTTSVETTMSDAATTTRPHTVRYGAAVGAQFLGSDTDYADLVAATVDEVTAENEMKWSFVHPDRHRYDFGPGDAVVDFARAHDLAVRGHTLVWHSQVPAWLEQGQFSREELLEILRDHITTVVGHYRGRVAQWDVVNEGVADDGRGLRDTLWRRGLGPEYIEHAFRFAHEADPDARLFYNDYGGETLGPKSDAVYDLLAGLVEKGVPIDGVGLQMHTTMLSLTGPLAGNTGASRPDPDDLAANLARLADLGLDIAITELDVRIPMPVESEELELQAQVYRDVAAACQAQPRCTDLVTWGLTDRYSWVPRFFDGFGAALPFDEALSPKPAWDALREALARPG